MMPLTWMDHLMVLALAVFLPIEGRFSRERLQRRVASGVPDPRRREYLATIALQWTLAALLVALWVGQHRPFAALGVASPSGWGFLAGLLLTAAGFVLLRAQVMAVERSATAATKVRAAAESLSFLLPATVREYRAMIPLAWTAGIVEELLYRGFMIWYFATFAPMWVAVLASSLLFGVAHMYQGPKGIPKTGAVGLAFAGLYKLSGSIWLPMLLHALVDLLQVKMLWVARHQPAEPTAPAITAAQTTAGR